MSKTIEHLSREQEDITALYYVIALTWTNSFDKTRTEEVFFKADRYSIYTGNLQIENHAYNGQQFKTEKGAKAAIDRYLAKGLFKPQHEPRVVRYTKVVTQRWDVMS